MTAGSACAATGSRRRSTAVGRDGFFMRRGDAEEDPTHKQVIPYLVLRDGERWFLMRRTRAAATPASTTYGRSGSAGTSTRATAMSPAGSGASGRRRCGRLRARLRPGGPPQRRHDAGRCRARGGRLRRRRGRTAGRDPRDGQAARARSPRPPRRQRSATRWRRGADSCSTRSSTGAAPRRTLCATECHTQAVVAAPSPCDQRGGLSRWTRSRRSSPTRTSRSRCS